MLYEVTGTLFIDIACNCPNCGGDYYDCDQIVTKKVEADSPKEAKEKALRMIRDEMEHDDAIVEWENGQEVEVTPDELPGTDQILLKLGATPLFPLEGFMK